MARDPSGTRRLFALRTTTEDGWRTLRRQSLGSGPLRVLCMPAHTACACNQLFAEGPAAGESSRRLQVPWILGASHVRCLHQHRDMANPEVTRFALLFAIVGAACTDPGPSTGSTGPGGKADGDFDDFLAQTYCEPDTGVCIVEGDLAIPGGQAGLREYFDSRYTAPGGLTVFREDEVDKLWNTLERRNLTYCVSSTEFSPTEHDQIVTAMAEATGDWEQVAYVDYRHVPEHDAHCEVGSSQVRFAVVKSPADATYIARAFFPYYADLDTAVRINLSELQGLTSRYPESSLRGVLRHELGHTLGFRHEHIRTENSSHCKEDENFRTITTYDRRSTMHYPFCDGAGDWSLQITELDAIGAAFFYPNYDKYRGDRCAGAEVRPDGTVNALCAPIVKEILELANTASFETLDTLAHLDRRAVETIIATRATTPFTTLAALDAVLYIGPVSVRRLYDYLYVTGRCAQEVDIDGLIDTRCRPVVHRLLELANTATWEALDLTIGIDSRAAENIVTTRLENPFASLVELWDLPYVKAQALKRLYEYLY